MKYSEKMELLLKGVKLSEIKELEDQEAKEAKEAAEAAAAKVAEEKKDQEEKEKTALEAANEMVKELEEKLASKEDELSKLNCSIGGWDSNFDPFYGAPVVLLVISDKSHPTCVYDGSLVMGNLMLAADSLGIGSCWIHRAKQEMETDYGKKLLLCLFLHLF